MEQKTLWIIVAVVLGTLVIALAVVLSLYCARRNKKKLRVFSLRAVTPLDDAVFESWRRPSQYTQRPERYGIRSSQPSSTRTTKTPSMMEKELGDYEFPPSSAPPIRKPERVHRKSSCASSLADRPPTPYSPASVSSEFPSSSFTSSKSFPGSPRTHYPSLSEASAFDFDFQSLYEEHSKRDRTRSNSQSDRPLNLSYGFDKV
ncbi:hypothetical protein DM02DRAFT_5336 [Periconia macrospinosa]|uniref:Uncharacterized protein n=1 Tax=Periconia macrospinosa TaxID=97972 RepID=A0A2V1EFM7_9PLEO|nr:hypothetical protein DM02DRAFT_5336 [Periconia macrospinosa]